MDRKKTHLVFYCTDPKETTYSKLELEGASGTISSMLWIAEGLASSGYSVTVLNENSSRSLITERGVVFVGLQSDELNHRPELLPCPRYVVLVGAPPSAKARKLIMDSASKLWFWHHNPVKLSSIKELQKLSIEKHIFVSANHAIRHLKINPKEIKSSFTKFNIIYNPINTNLLREHSTPRNSTDSNPDSIKIAYIGNTSQAKGFPNFLDLINRLESRGPQDIEWHIFGAGLYGNQDNSHCQRNNRILSHGTIGRTSLYERILNADFIACGLGGNETFCVAAVEAAFLGKTVITSGKGGQIETLSSYRNKINIDKAKTTEDLLNIKSRRIAPHDLQRFRLLCDQIYSIEATVRQWAQLLGNERTTPHYLHNISGLVRSLAGRL